MGNCFAKGRELQVHPAVQPLTLEGAVPGESSQIKVRMTSREFRELISQAESRKCSADAMVGVLIVLGVQQGRWEAVRGSGVAEGRGSPNTYRNGRAALETIQEESCDD